MKTAIIAGSFDPITVGHTELIERAYELFGSVRIVMVTNSQKNYMFDKDTRLAAIKACFDNPKIIAEHCDGLLAEYAGSIEGGVLVRGIRTAADAGYELELADISYSLEGVETVILPCRPGKKFISSAFVRELYKYRRSRNGFVCDSADKILTNRTN